ncbi:MAG TPA: acetyl-CoA carboxylase biotin carboxyl carrier protein, partial [Thermoanaerobaculia bacterium]|nr:acetyl-CoA carboxylase biotin carboxyl carrier protein [Thermoanaerobaculia bacterium]
HAPAPLHLLSTTPHPVPPAPAFQSMPTTTAHPAPPAEPPGDELELAVVKSPIVGTFYRASEPGAKPYADVGDTVKKGQVLCIIEAMKLMNEIESDVDGRVAAIYPQNGQPVEYGEKLFGIETS